MRKKIFYLLCFLCLLAPTLRAKEKTTIAVYELNANGVSSEMALVLTDILRDVIFHTGNYEMLTREDMQRILDNVATRQQIQSDCDTDKCLAELAGALGVSEMISGSVGKIGKTFVLNLRLVDAELARTKNTVSVECPCEEEVLLGKIKEAGFQLLKMDKPESAIVQHWQNTGNLNDARIDHTATLLKNGQVLVTGGRNGDQRSWKLLSSCEIYDPAARKWSYTNNLNLKRYNHQALRLNDGRVLVMAGDAGGYTLKDCEIYDPETQKWTLTGKLNVKRANFSVVQLHSGQVLVIGGHEGNDVHSTSCEIYDPVTGIWKLTGKLHTGRSVFTAVLLPDGEVLAVGGRSGKVNYEKTCELYDPLTGQWRPADNLIDARAWHTATLLKDGRVLVSGGWISPNDKDYYYLSSCEIYDPLTQKWSLTDNFPQNRIWHTSTLLNDGRVLVVAGFCGGKPLAGCEIYGSLTNLWAKNVEVL